MQPVRHTKRRLRLSAVALACTVASVANAQVQTIERRAAVSVGAEHSDNVARLPSQDATGLTYGTFGLDLGVLREGRRLRAHIDGDLSYHRYNSSDFDDETLGSLIAGATVGLMPESLTWELHNSTGHVRTDPFAAAGPTNRERLNVFSTGPDWIIDLANGLGLQFGGRYTDRRWSDSDQLDSTGDSVQMSLVHTMDSAHQLGVTLLSRRTEFDLPHSPQYDVDAAYLTFAGRGRHSELEFALGVNRVDSAGVTSRSPFLQTRWLRRLTARSTLSLDASRSFEDAGDQLSGAFAAPGTGGVGDVPLAADPIERDRLSVSYRLDRSRTVYSLSTDWSQESYLTLSVLDRSGWRSSFTVDRRMSPIWTASLQVFSGRETFDIDAASATERGAALNVDRRLSRTWRLHARVEHASREGDLFGNFRENRYRLSFVWAPSS